MDTSVWWMISADFSLSGKTSQEARVLSAQLAWLPCRSGTLSIPGLGIHNPVHREFVPPLLPGEGLSRLPRNAKDRHELQGDHGHPTVRHGIASVFVSYRRAQSLQFARQPVMVRLCLGRIRQVGRVNSWNRVKQHVFHGSLLRTIHAKKSCVKCNQSRFTASRTT
jgi:hypothetical protein